MFRQSKVLVSAEEWALAIKVKSVHHSTQLNSDVQFMVLKKITLFLFNSLELSGKFVFFRLGIQYLLSPKIWLRASSVSWFQQSIP